MEGKQQKGKHHNHTMQKHQLMAMPENMFVKAVRFPMQAKIITEKEGKRQGEWGYSQLVLPAQPRYDRQRWRWGRKWQGVRKQRGVPAWRSGAGKALKGGVPESEEYRLCGEARRISGEVRAAMNIAR